MARTKLVAAVAATALALTAGASTATAFYPEHPNAQAVENCAANVAKQFELGLTGGNGAKSDTFEHWASWRRPTATSSSGLPGRDSRDQQPLAGRHKTRRMSQLWPVVPR